MSEDRERELASRAPAAYYAKRNQMDLAGAITRSMLIDLVDDPEGMDRFLEWLTGEANVWPKWVGPYR